MSGGRGVPGAVPRPQLGCARMAFGLFLVLVLVAGGSAARQALPADPVVGAAGLVETGGRVHGDEVRRPRLDRRHTGGGGLRPEPRPTVAWRDLRCGGLPAPRAPDRGTTPAFLA